MNNLIRIYYFIIHFFSARNTKGFGIHSPYLYRIVRNVIYEKKTYYIQADIEKQRTNLLKNNARIKKIDFGTGKTKLQKISEIASTSSCTPRKGLLICRLANYLNLKNILELGTSFGLSTAYLVSRATSRRCITLEGCENTAKIAHKTFETLGLKNIEIITGNIDDTLQIALEKLPEIDLVYVDANHTYEATMRYFEILLPKLSAKSIVVFDDIYWSKGMKMAWTNIKSNKKVTASIDLFELGIVFFNPDLNKMHFKLLY